MTSWPRERRDGIDGTARNSHASRRPGAHAARPPGCIPQWETPVPALVRLTGGVGRDEMQPGTAWDRGGGDPALSVAQLRSRWLVPPPRPAPCCHQGEGVLWWQGKLLPARAGGRSAEQQQTQSHQLREASSRWAGRTPQCQPQFTGVIN